MTGMRTSVAALLAITMLGCAACGASGAKDQPEAAPSKDRLQACPKNAPGHRDNENPHAKNAMAPPGAESALICRYRGSRTGGSSSILETENLRPGSKRLKRLEQALNRLDPVRLGAVACPTGRPLRYLVVFHYRRQSDDYVMVDFNGCGLVNNDALKRSFYPSERLRRILR